MKESKAKKRGTIAVKIDALVPIMVILSNIICLSVLVSSSRKYIDRRCKIACWIW